MRTTMQLLFFALHACSGASGAVIDNTVFRLSIPALRNVLLAHVVDADLLPGPANACVPQVSRVLGSNSPEAPTTHPKCVRQ